MTSRDTEGTEGADFNTEPRSHGGYTEASP